MRSIRWMLAAMAVGLVACGDKEEDSGDGSGLPSGPVYPSGQSILLFNGNGGADGDGGGEGGVEGISARWSSQGYTVRVKDTLPSDLTEYRAVIMVAPGYFGGAANFSEEEIAELDRVIGLGTRLVILTENGACGEVAINNLLTALGVSIRVLNDSEQENRVLDINKFGYESQVTEGLTALVLHDPCYVDSASGKRLFADNDGHILGAAEQVGNGGDVVLIGDIRFLDDGGYIDEADNGKLADNIVTIEPSSDGE